MEFAHGPVVRALWVLAELSLLVALTRLGWRVLRRRRMASP